MTRLVFTATLAVVVLAAAARAAEMSERQKIEALIKHVEGLQDVKFVRNGEAHDAKTAAKFLRGKWDAHTADIKTAIDFIDKAATKSSTTGKPYLIRLKGGKEVPSADYLRAELKKLEAGGGKRAP